MYKALINIDKFKKGDEVPEGTAKVWEKMYVVSPVELVEGKPSNKQVPQFIEKQSTVSPMLEDYLARNESVVMKNVKTDKLSNTEMKNLLLLEKSGKNRKHIVSALKKRLGFR